jgi:hypothetical protein
MIQFRHWAAAADVVDATGAFLRAVPGHGLQQQLPAGCQDPLSRPQDR